MQTKIDSYIEKYVLGYVEKGFVSSDSIQSLLDAARNEYGIDKVDIVETMPGSNSLFFTYASMAGGTTYVGTSIDLPPATFDALLNVYGEDGLCDHLAIGFDKFITAPSVLHFGFFSTRDFYGMVGYQSNKRRLWSREEKNALIKIGRAITPYIIEKQSRVRMRRFLQQEEQFKKAIMSDNLFCFTVDLSKDIMTEEVNFEDKGVLISLLEVTGLSAPCKFSEFMNRSKAFLVEDSKGVFDSVDSCDKLIDAYKNGKTNISIEFGMYFENSGEVYTRETFIITKDEVYGTLSVICMCKDITDVRAKEIHDKQALKEALDVASNANAAKTDFLSRMSHDIRTPMNAIIGMTTIAEAHLDDKIKLKDSHEKILSASKHLLGIINNILDMSKIEAGKMVLADNEFNIHSIVDELESIARPLCVDKGHELTLTVGNIDHPNVIGDDQKIMQVFVNLVSNSVKYTPNGGHIAITVTEEVEKNQNIGSYKFIIEDDGVGMSEEFLEKLYNPFERAEDIRTSKTQGTGLGMAITKSIIQMMGGDIKVESSLGVGTKFIITLYLKLSASKENGNNIEFASLEEVVSSTAERDYTTKRLLVVEDNELNREIAVELLSATGFMIDTAEDGMEAVQKYSGTAPEYYDAILMDIQMPVMNGYEACEHIRALTRRDAANVPIIAMTANAFSEDVEAALKAGMNAHIAKPLDIKLLLAELDKWIFE